MSSGARRGTGAAGEAGRNDAIRVRVAGVEETADGEPVAVAVENALRKARAVAALEPAGTLVLGADTVIVDRTEPMPRAVGKPADAAAAAAMLARWSGADHHVASAAAVVRAGEGEDHEVLLADADKFDGVGLARVCGCEAIDVLITDGRAPGDALARLEQAGVRVLVA